MTRRRWWRRNKDKLPTPIQGFARSMREDVLQEAIEVLYRWDHDAMKWRTLYGELTLRQMRKLFKRVVG